MKVIFKKNAFLRKIVKSTASKSIIPFAGVVLIVFCFSFFFTKYLNQEVSSNHKITDNHQQNAPDLPNRLFELNKGKCLNPNFQQLAVCWAPDTDPAYIKNFYASKQL